MNNLLSALILGTCLTGTGAALAHGNNVAKHGGIVQTASDLSFELVPQADGAILHVEDHGKPMATQNMRGKLTVLNGAAKSEAEFKPAGDNRLEARGLKLGKGAKAVAALNTSSGKAITVRFTVK